MNIPTTVGLATCRALVRVRVRTDLFKHFVEISEYPGVLLDQFLELENDRRKLLLVNVTCLREDTILDELNEQFALELPDDVGVRREPSGDGTTVFDLKRHVELAVIVNLHREIASIGLQDDSWNSKRLTGELEANDEKMKGECWNPLYCNAGLQT